MSLTYRSNKSQKITYLKALLQKTMDAQGLKYLPDCAWDLPAWEIRPERANRPWSVILSYPTSTDDMIVDRDVAAIQTLPDLGITSMIRERATVTIPYHPGTTYEIPLSEGHQVGPLPQAPEAGEYVHVPRKVRRLLLAPR